MASTTPSSFKFEDSSGEGAALPSSSSLRPCLLCSLDNPDFRPFYLLQGCARRFCSAWWRFSLCQVSCPPRPATSAVTAKETGKKFTRAQVAEHNKPHDLWVIVNGKVYDLTDFVSQVSQLLLLLPASCGKPEGEALLEPLL